MTQAASNTGHPRTRHPDMGESRLLSKIMRVVIGACACALACPAAAAFTDAEFCTSAQEIARRINAGSPSEISESLTLEGASVMCATKVLQFRKRAAVVLQLGWRKDRTKIWSNAVCKDLFLEASRNGWRITELVSFADGQQIETYASCN
jgi:hypothetical protein